VISIKIRTADVSGVKVSMPGIGAKRNRMLPDTNTGKSSGSELEGHIERGITGYLLGLEID